MGQITSYLLGGFAAVASWSMVAPQDGSAPSPLSMAFQTSPAASSAGVNRAAKGDRLAPVQPGEKRAVTTIEVVGVRDAAIIYRDRDGNMLYRTDPVNNVTVIAKGVKLPDVTVRQDAHSSIRSVPVDVPDGKKAKMPIGCESVASPIASPHLSHVTGRCISQIAAPVKVASANK